MNYSYRKDYQDLKPMPLRPGKIVRLHKLRVLLIGFDSETSKQLRPQLESLGYYPLGVAPSVDSALSESQYDDPDIVLFDLETMFSSLDPARARQSLARLRAPCIAMVKESTSEILSRLLTLTPCGVLTLPCTDFHLESNIELGLLRYAENHSSLVHEPSLLASLSFISDGVIITDADRIVRWMNPAAERLTAWAVDDATGMAFSEVCHIEEASTLVARDGTRRSIQMHTSFTDELSSRVRGTIVVLRDLLPPPSDSVHFSMRDQEYRLLMEEAGDAITITDPQGNYIAVNTRTCELLGYTREELLKLHIRDLIPPETRDTDPIRFTELRAGMTLTRERRLLRKDGSIIDVEISAKMLSNGTLQGIIRDITERKHADREMTRAVRGEVVDRLLSKLRAFSHGESSLANLSRLALCAENMDALFAPGDAAGSLRTTFESTCHEYLAAVMPRLRDIVSLLTIMTSDEKWNGTLMDWEYAIREISMSSQSLRNVLTTLLEHLLSGSPPLMHERLAAHSDSVYSSVNDLRKTLLRVADSMRSHFTCDVGEVLAMIGGKFPSRANITIDLPFPDHRVPACISYPDLSESLSILVENAVEELQDRSPDDPGRITISVGEHGSRVLISVSDNGRGIPTTDRQMLLSPEYTTKGPGHGSGLPHAAHCVAKYGGTFRLDASYAQGARFIIDVPRA